MSANILITGAAGTTGSKLANIFSLSDLNYRVMFHDAGKKTKITDEKAEIYIGDFEDIGSLEKAMEGIEKIYLVSPPSERQVEYQTNALKAAKNRGVKHIVKLSALGTSDESDISLLKWHAVIENEIKDSGINYTFLHPHFFMENFFNDAESARVNYTLYSALGKTMIGAVAAEDVAAVAFKALTETGHENKTYEITGPELINYHDAAHILSDLIQTKIHYVEVPYEYAKQEMRKHGLPEWFAEDLIKLQKKWNETEDPYLTDVVINVGKKDPVYLRDFLIKHINLFKT